MLRQQIALHVTMPPKKKLGYNWKARQQKRVDRIRKQNLSAPVRVEFGSPATDYVGACGDDSNVLVLPSKRKAPDSDEAERTLKRKKLSGKQRKRLLKVLETKEKKARHTSLLSRLSSLALPDSEMALLTPTTSLGTTRTTERQLQRQAEARGAVCGKVNLPPVDPDEPSLVGTSWRRKKRKRRQLRAEKILYDPRARDGDGSDDGGTMMEGLVEPRVSGSSHGREVSSDESSNGGDELEQGSDRGSELGCASGLEHDSEGNSTKHASEKGLMEGGGEDVSSQQASTTPAIIDTVATSECTSVARQPVMYLHLQRDPEIQMARLSLPILSEEQAVMEAISDHLVVLLCGETGSGKTTQVPQFLYEAGYTQRGRDSFGSMIGITEPRRVAAVSMSKRVALEMGLSTRQVSYQIRYEGNTTDDTLIKFITDGVLLREVEKDFLLSRYSAIVIDEAHERSVFTDILIGLLSRIVPLREKHGYPLKLVIMSATLRVEDFTENRRLFPSPPPVIKVESRQYPVTVHFNKRTPVDYLVEAYRKVCKIHRTLKAGNILVFVTGQMEVHSLCRKLQRRFPSVVDSRIGERERGGKGEGGKRRKCGRRHNEARQQHAELNLDDYPAAPRGADFHEWEDEEGGEEEEKEDKPNGIGSTDSSSEGEWEEGVMGDNSLDSQLPLLVLPLYSLLSTKLQAKVFQPPRDGVRMCVVATNVAETSLTIPNTKYVVDTGKVKRRYYDKVTGVSAFRVVWTAKASANQRAGRAGRTEPGHCYRLYSSAVFHNEFEQFSPPEITRRPVDDLVLQMKSLNIDRVVNFPFPTPPSGAALDVAEKLLVKLGALCREEAQLGRMNVSRITALGRTMVQFPVAPRFAKMLSLGKQHGCLPYIIAIVATLSVKEIFADSDKSLNKQSEQKGRTAAERLTSMRRAWAGKGESLLLGDVMVLLRAVGACEFSGCSEEFCRRNRLRFKAMAEIRKLRQQLTNAVNVICPDAGVFIDPKMPPPTEEQAKYLRQIILSGLGDHVARLFPPPVFHCFQYEIRRGGGLGDLVTCDDIRKISTEGMNTEDRKRLRHAYQSSLCEAPVFLHPSCVLLHTNPDFVVFQEMVETSKLYMREVMAVEEDWLPLVQPQFCTFSPPLDDPPPFFDSHSGTVRCYRSCTYGECCWPITAQELPYPDGLDKYKLFAQFLLQGKVIPALTEFTPYLLVAPVTMVKTWAKLHRHVEVLLSALVNREVVTREGLLEAWRVDPKYLLKAYSLWLPESRHKSLAAMWPPLDCR